MEGMICSCHQLPAPTLPAGRMILAQQDAVTLHLLARAAEQPGAQFPARTSCPCQHQALIPGSPLLSWQEQGESQPAAAAPSCSSAVCSRTWGAKHNRIREGALLKYQSLALGCQNWPTGKQQ